MFTIHELNSDNSIGLPVFTAPTAAHALALAQSLTCAITSPGWDGFVAVVQPEDSTFAESPEVFRMFPWSSTPPSAANLADDLLRGLGLIPA